MNKLFKKMETKKESPTPTLKTVKQTAKPTLKKTEEPKMKNQIKASKDTVSKPTREISSKTVNNVNGVDLSRVPEQYRNDPTLKIEKNKIFVQNKTADGELLWEKVDGKIKPVYKDITPVAKPVGNVKQMPMPSGEHFEMIMFQHAQKAVEEASKNKEESSLINQTINGA
jgi:hypothetical protein